jgi:hypothetical protein
MMERRDVGKETRTLTSILYYLPTTAFEHGAFGVPTFWIESRKKMIWGQDRMHLLEAELISIKLGKPVERIRQLERLHPRCLR